MHWCTARMSLAATCFDGTRRRYELHLAAALVGSEISSGELSQHAACASLDARNDHDRCMELEVVLP